MNSEQIAACQKIHEKARYFRGRFLNTVAVIEHTIAVILTEYFCRDDEQKKELFFSEVVENLSLNKKREILRKIVKEDYPNFWDKNQKLLENLSEIQKFRNKLAHSIIDVSEAALSRPIDEGVGFIQWKCGEPITQIEFTNWDIRASEIISTLKEIKMLLPFKEKKSE